MTSGAGLIAAAIAGCIGGDDEEGGEGGEGGGNGDGSGTEGDDGDGETPYEVTVEPAGTHTFEEVPETYATIPGAWMDLSMAFGIQPEGLAYLERHPTKFYDQLPEVEFDEEEVVIFGDGESARSYDKEVFYEMDADVHLMDPRMLQEYSGWSDEDVAEIEGNVAPYLGSQIRFDFDGQEPYYTMYEALERNAEIFQRQGQYEAWVELHEEFIADVEAELPPEDERPSVAVFWRGLDADAGEFNPAPIYEKRNDTQSYRDLGLVDAFEDQHVDGPVGYETLLEVEPDYLSALNLSSMTGEEWQAEVVSPLENHSTASELQAVQNGNVVRAAGQFMGPIVHLFSTEALAKQVFPERFGEWPGDSEAIPDEEHLFDRERVAEIVTGV